MSCCRGLCQIACKSGCARSEEVHGVRGEREVACRSTQERDSVASASCIERHAGRAEFKLKPGTRLHGVRASGGAEVHRKIPMLAPGATKPPLATVMPFAPVGAICPVPPKVPVALTETAPVPVAESVPATAVFASRVPALTSWCRCRYLRRRGSMCPRRFS